MNSDVGALRDRATQLGVETSFWDVEGTLHYASESTLRAIVEVLEADAAADRAELGTGRLDPVIVPRDGRVRLPAGTTARGVTLALADGTVGRAGVSGDRIELPPDVPIGCHVLQLRTDDGDRTATLVVAPARMPRDPVLTGSAGLFVPAYALWEPDAPLPSFAGLGDLAAAIAAAGVDVLATLPLYAAFLDEPFDPSPYAPASRLHWNEVYIDDGTLPPGPPVQDRAERDWRLLARRRREQLLRAAADLDAPTAGALEQLRTERPDVAAFARFMAGRVGGDGRPVALVERSHVLAQHLADLQLAAVERPGRAALALDLPIGSHPEGYEVWADPTLFADGMTVGAPPDEFFRDGQDWAFPPPLPSAGRRSGHMLWRRLVTRAGEHASMLRIDHVMGVHRLWWIPAGAGAADGAYVRYPREEILAVIAAEAHVAGTTIVGEDLGTVPGEVRDAMARWDALGLYEEQFHLFDEQLADVPARAVAGVRTHDMPAFATAYADSPPAARDAYRRRLERAVGHTVPATPDGVLDAVIERLASSPAYMVVADLDDLLGETAPHNVPGRIEPTAWRRRLAEPTSAAMARPGVRRRLELLATRTPAAVTVGEGIQ